MRISCGLCVNEYLWMSPWAPEMGQFVGRLCQHRCKCGKLKADDSSPRGLERQGNLARSFTGHTIAWAPLGVCPGKDM